MVGITSKCKKYATDEEPRGTQHSHEEKEGLIVMGISSSVKKSESVHRYTLVCLCFTQTRKYLHSAQRMTFYFIFLLAFASCNHMSMPCKRLQIYMRMYTVHTHTHTHSSAIVSGSDSGNQTTQNDKQEAPPIVSKHSRR